MSADNSTHVVYGGDDDVEDEEIDDYNVNVAMVLNVVHGEDSVDNGEVEIDEDNDADNYDDGNKKVMAMLIKAIIMTVVMLIINIMLLVMTIKLIVMLLMVITIMMDGEVDIEDDND